MHNRAMLRPLLFPSSMSFSTTLFDVTNGDSIDFLCDSAKTKW